MTAITDGSTPSRCLHRKAKEIDCACHCSKPAPLRPPLISSWHERYSLRAAGPVPLATNLAATRTYERLRMRQSRMAALGPSVSDQAMAVRPVPSRCDGTTISKSALLPGAKDSDVWQFRTVAN